MTSGKMLWLIAKLQRLLAASARKRSTGLTRHVRQLKQQRLLRKHLLSPLVKSVMRHTQHSKLLKPVSSRLKQPQMLTNTCCRHHVIGQSICWQMSLN